MLYEEAGVDIKRADNFVKGIPRFLTNTGLLPPNGFAGGYAHTDGSSFYVTCDGVGSKIEMARKLEMYHGLGIDLVAMNVNDLICHRAQPVGFLNYIATHRIAPFMDKILEGIVDGCKIANCSLLGGETSEMPSVYEEGKFDIAGFAMGIRDSRPFYRDMMSGDVIIGLKSSGVHANGFALINKLCDPDPAFLEPTKIYSTMVGKLIKEFDVLGIAHITGGGLRNIERCLSADVSAIIKKSYWRTPAIFDKIPVDEEEKYRIFNMGIGMVIVIGKNDADRFIKRVCDHEEQAVVIGEITWELKEKVYVE